MINRLNSQLPPMPQAAQPFIERRHIYGFLFLFTVGSLLIFLIYNWQYGGSAGPNPALGDSNSQVCIQVITPAKNPETDEVVEYATPCDVPEGWIVIRNSSN